MPETHTIVLFVPVALGLLVVPGPAVLYIVTRSIDQGRTAGLVSVMGIHVGSLVHVAAAAFGLSAILLSSSLAFGVVKYAGAAYLIVLGVRKLLSTKDDDLRVDEDPPGRSLRRVFTQGVIVNVLNPKTALFFLALLPQFVDVDRGAVWLQMVVLGLAFIALGFVSDGAYALVAARAGGWLRSSDRFQRVQRYVSGGIYVSLGAAAALTGARTDH
jgi:threonine/homoserine/homoserine lactone efflux protein